MLQNPGISLIPLRSVIDSPPTAEAHIVTSACQASRHSATAPDVAHLTYLTPSTATLSLVSLLSAAYSDLSHQLAATSTATAVTALQNKESGLSALAIVGTCDLCHRLPSSESLSFARSPSFVQADRLGITLAATLIPMGICGIFALSRSRHSSSHQHQHQQQQAYLAPHSTQAYPGQYNAYALSPQHKKVHLPYEYSSIYAPQPPQHQLPAYLPPQQQYSYYAPAHAPTHQSYYGHPQVQAPQEQPWAGQAGVAMPQAVAIQPSGSYYSHAPQARQPQAAVPEPEPAKGVRFGQVAVRRYETDE